ncbi:hypothetical protein ULG90_20885 [Halopseudomonas pachastrellae]|nr:hypothetical protein ULG90_20885 [Halopseudomonas pachastrellae]
MKDDLKVFQDNEKTIPTILTTSRKLSTGGTPARAQHRINAALQQHDRVQADHRPGTRLYDGKDYFTIYDFVKAHYNFADPAWDGEPLPPEDNDCATCGNYPCTCSKEPCLICGFNPCSCVTACPVCAQAPCCCPTKSCPHCQQNPCVCANQDCPVCGVSPCECGKPEKLVIHLSDGKSAQHQHIASALYWSPEGKPITAKEFIERLFGEIPRFFSDEDQLRHIWSDPSTRENYRKT